MDRLTQIERLRRAQDFARQAVAMAIPVLGHLAPGDYTYLARELDELQDAADAIGNMVGKLETRRKEANR